MTGQWHFDAKVDYHLVTSSPVPLALPNGSHLFHNSHGIEFSPVTESSSSISLSSMSGSSSSSSQNRKKRASGLRLLRPSSSKGRQLEPSISITPVSAISPPPLSPIPFTSRLTSFASMMERAQVGITNAQLPTSVEPEEQLEDEEEDYVMTRREEAYEAQRASLRHPRSITQLRSLDFSTTGPDQTSQLLTGPERLLPKRWAVGRIEAILQGEGGVDGGFIRLYHAIDRLNSSSPSIQRHPFFTLSIPRLTPDEEKQAKSGAGRSTWGLGDVQTVPRSVSERSHSLSLRIPSNVSSSSSGEPLSGFTGRTSGSGDGLDNGADQPRRRAGILSDRSRSRSKTVSAVGEKRDSQETTTTTTTSSTMSSTMSEMVAEHLLYLSFPTENEQRIWYALLKSLADGRDVSDTHSHGHGHSHTHAHAHGNGHGHGQGQGYRTHRRMKMWILDLTEMNVGGDRGVKKSDESSYRGQELSLDSVSRDGTAEAGRAGKFNGAPGWSGREHIRVELVVDGTVWARTAWAKADSSSVTPFWGECFSFTEFPAFTTCSLLLFRKTRSRRAALFATVQLPLVPSFAHGEDERFHIRSIANEAVIGEMRISVAFREISVLPRSAYMNEENPLVMTNADELALTYHLAADGQLEDAHETICRLGLAQGFLLPMLLDMCSFESESTGSTLFRSNTVFSKTLESAMRLLCHDFLKSSIGPTVRYVVENKIGVKLHQDVMAHVPIPSGVATMNKLAESCWVEMYAKRNAFPDFLRHVFAHLFRTVKDVHDDNQRLRYKAVSCFVFLRLLGPALMRPHLFGLAEGLLLPDQQRILTILAKILHALAFFSDKDLARDPQLGLFQPFIKAQSESMVDYLTSFTTPLDDWQSRSHPSVIETFLAERRTHLSPLLEELQPTMTLAGPVDVGAETAVLLETLYERRRVPSKVPGVVQGQAGPAGQGAQGGRSVPSPDGDMGRLEEVYGAWVEGVHMKVREAKREHRRADTPISRFSPPNVPQPVLITHAQFPIREKEKEKDDGSTIVSDTTGAGSGSMCTPGIGRVGVPTLWSAVGLAGVAGVAGLGANSGGGEGLGLGLGLTGATGAGTGGGGKRESGVGGEAESFRTAVQGDEDGGDTPVDERGRGGGCTGGRGEERGNEAGEGSGKRPLDSPVSTIVDWLELASVSGTTRGESEGQSEGAREREGEGDAEGDGEEEGVKSTPSTLAARNFRRPSLPLTMRK